ncbi:SLC13 family permease [Raoultibacter massiliensis]|uniref:SLC13 family permease n=1 Tax=Raoultibacter massiliensis TaxID=1852371 RepID=UPI003A91BB94
MSEVLMRASLRPRNVACILLAVAIIAATALAPPTAGLTYEGRMVLGILGAGILLWVTESLPLPATALLILVMMPIMGVCTFDEAYANAMGSTVFFLMGAFAFTVALDATTIPTRIAAFVLRWSGTDTNKMLLGFMCATAFLSFFMSDVAACGVFISVGKRLLELNEAEKLKSPMGKAMMIAIPWASYAGGCAVMTGNGCNVITVGLFSSLFGVNMNFIEWSMLGFPFCVIMLFSSWFIITRFFKPEPITQASIDATMAEVSDMGRISRPEVMTIVIIALAMVFWILSSWFSFLNTAMIAIFAIVLLSVPGCSTLEFKGLVSRMNWGVLLMIMCILSVAHFVVATGAGDWMVAAVVAALPESWKVPVVVLIVLSTIGAIVHNIVPVGPAVAGILAYPFGVIAGDFGISMYCMLMVVAWQASLAYILPLDCVPILTYSTGYYKMSDMVKVGWIPTVLLVALTSTLLPALCMLFGFA